MFYLHEYLAWTTTLDVVAGLPPEVHRMGVTEK